MLKDFSKLETFLLIARERSFVKASAKLGISHAAVTKKINFIERYLGCKSIERKKNDIRLTSEGKELYQIATRMEKEINASAKDILKIINKKMTFRLGASSTIGTYVIHEECLTAMSESINNDVNLSMDSSDTIVQKLKDRKLDVGLIESRVNGNDLICREWLEDELVLVSNVPIPKIVKTKDLYDYRWIICDESSPARQVVSKVFKKLGVSYSSFDVISKVSDTTVILQTIKKSKKIKDKPIVAVISKYAITDEVAKGELFEARLQGYTMTRKFFILYSKKDKHNAYVDHVVDYILTGQCQASV